MARSQAEIQAGQPLPEAAAGRPGSNGEDAGPTLISLWFVNKPHFTLETLKWGPDLPLQPTKQSSPSRPGSPEQKELVTTRSQDGGKRTD